MDSRPDALFDVLADDLTGPLGYRLTSLRDAQSFDVRFFEPRQAACIALANSFCKKITPRNGAPHLRDRATALFESMNLRCKAWSPTLHSLSGLVIDEMAFIASRELGHLDWQSCLTRMTVGPGASVGSRGRNSFFEKLFTSQLTTTSPELYTEFRRFMLKRDTWWSAELRRIALNKGTPLEVVGASKLSTVRKTLDIDRTICTEPSLNMAFQLSLGERFNDVLLKKYGYDPALQPDRNRRLARLGSMNDAICTIDLSSASDTIALGLVEYLLPSNWYQAVLDCRSAATMVPDKTGFHRVDLHMVSSMGNGFTFPLETYIFSLMTKALARVMGVKWRRFNSESCFGVFGDDIIVPASLYEPALRVLEDLGFIPNPDKSFGTGPFRESCGTDWHSGVDIRGVYYRGGDSLQDRFSVVNRLNRWSTKHSVPLRSLIRHFLPKTWQSFTVPSDEADTAGVKVPLSLKPRRPKYGRAPQGLYRYQAFRPRSRALSIYSREGLLKPAFNNPIGLWLTASIGKIDSTGIQRRQAEPMYGIVKLAAPFWCREQDFSPHGLSLSDWEFFTEFNLTLNPVSAY